MTNTFSLLSDNLNDVINSTSSVLNNGGVIIYPTDTIYGIGCNALNSKSVDKIFTIKERDSSKPMLMLINNQQMLSNFVDDISIYANKIITKYWPGSVTLIFQANKSVPKNLLSEDGKIAFRWINNLFCNSIIEATGNPLISTSANISGQNSSNNFSELLKLFSSKVDLLIEGPTNSNISSTIIDTTISPPKILRQGDLFIDFELL